MLFGARCRKSSDESSLSRSAKVFERSESARTSMERTGRSASSRGNGSYVPVTMIDSRFAGSFDPSDCGRAGYTNSREITRAIDSTGSAPR